MNKTKTLVLMLCFILSGALCHAHGVAGTGNAKGEDIPIEIMRKSNRILCIAIIMQSIYNLD